MTASTFKLRLYSVACFDLRKSFLKWSYETLEKVRDDEKDPISFSSSKQFIEILIKAAIDNEIEVSDSKSK